MPISADLHDHDGIEDDHQEQDPSNEGSTGEAGEEIHLDEGKFLFVIEWSPGEFLPQGSEEEL